MTTSSAPGPFAPSKRCGCWPPESSVAAPVAAETARGHALGCGDRFVQGRVEWIEAFLADAAGDTAEAYRHIERGLVLIDQLGMGQEVTTQAGLLVALAERRGQHQLGAQWRTFVAGRSGGLARHDVLLIASARNVAGLHARSAGELDRARAAHLEALAGYEEAGVSGAVAFTQSCLGFLATEMGDRAGAADHHTAALKVATTSGEAGALALALEGTAGGLDDDQAEWAAALLGAAGSLWAESAGKSGATHRDDVAEVADRSRRILGPARFTVAYERGALMSRAEAAASALSPVRDATSASHQGTSSP